jgi:cell division protein FtsI (penicillin-binding protein 3)
VGFVGMDGVGLEGIEKSFDEVLRGCPTKVGQVRDGGRRCLWLNSSAPPEPAESRGVKLTIDAFIQYLAECELEKAVLQYRAKAGEVVVIDAKTSEVLAMANWPYFDPNLPDKNDPRLWKNRTITDSFEPGSTFKVFTLSAAIQEKMVRERDRIFCEQGRCRLAGHTIKDVHPYGWLTMQEVIKYSSNIAAAKIALNVGSERLSRYIRGFGFGSPTGIALPGEVKGQLRPFRRWRPIDLAVTGFGQSIGVTPLQLSAAVNAIANDGEYSAPIIAREIVDVEGRPIKQFRSLKTRQVIQKKTAEQIRAMMALVTLEGGTGVKAVPPGYTAAGKTGTAQVMDPETKRYASGKYTSAFTGYIPAEQPRLVITVVIHEPHGASYGGVVAAPVFREIAANALPYLGVMPSVPDPAPVPAVCQVKANPAGARGKAGAKASSPANSARQDLAPKSVRKKDSAIVQVNAGKDRQKPNNTSRTQPEKYSKAEGQESGLY